MKLIQIQGDVIVATDVSVIGVVEKELTVALRDRDEFLEYQFETEIEAAEAARQAVNVLRSL